MKAADLMHQTVNQFAKAAAQPMPVVSLSDALRMSVPCVVERDGMRFIHDPEVAYRTKQFFGVMP